MDEEGKERKGIKRTGRKEVERKIRGYKTG